ncbi:DHA2 family efflux MFS transporter permease subunit [Endozoicomonas elysicola]|uniref:Multidrug MFS transporter n=1 Tax=Endozoicomonas elysicola TaxID=305900 RepID=A0A081KC69_9GAMM|nr:DHA2 family efflux MFS transporter permease subunit [Endozoicomonas elysicola]KEI71745.1 multidrug MFS transporter [Endozoicomonas elysicola]
MSNNISRQAITITIILSSLMVLIDMTVANVALPDMMGTLGATSEQITWVLTSFSMAEAICIPLAGFLTLRFGERQLLLYSIAGFIVMSAMCGQADSLMEMIFFRIFQGIFGAAVIPLSQSVLMQVYPKEEQGRAMALFAIGVMVGPVLGPVIGGILTEHLNWRWVFYINLPVGGVCLLLIFRNIQISNRGKSSVDWLLIITMALGIGLLQMVLSQGNEKNWFSSDFILLSTIISVLMITAFIIRSFWTKGEIAPVWLLKDRNLAISCLIVSCFAVGTFGVLQLQPMLLQELLNYPVETSGFIMAPRGVASAVVLIMAAPLMDKLDSRILIFVGLVFNAVGVWQMSLYSLEIDPFWIVLPSIIQGAGLGLVFAPLSKIAFSTLDPAFITGGTAMFNLCRTIGSSIGIAVINTYFSYVKQLEWQSLGGSLSPDNRLLQNYAEVAGQGITNTDFLEQIAALLKQQSSMLAFVYCFTLMVFIYLFLILLLPIFRKKAPASSS